MAQSFEILLVEDSPADAHLTLKALEDASIVYGVHVVQDGVQALKFAVVHHMTPLPDQISFFWI